MFFGFKYHSDNQIVLKLLSQTCLSRHNLWKALTFSLFN